MHTVIGASGNTGRIVAERLLARGEKVRAIGRSADRLANLAKKGAEAFVADATDATALTRAFAGARTAYIMIPPNLIAADVRAYQERVSDATTAALEKAGVEYAVMLSSVGADKPAKTGPVVGLHAFEQKLDRLARLNAIYLRAGYFMENLFPQISVIKNFGVVGGPLRADLAVAMIATEDIGDFAANTLLKLDFRGKRAVELLGPRDVTYQEVSGIVGKALGKPGLGYMQLPATQLKPAMVGMGMSSSMADLILEMAEALNSGYMAPLESRSASNSTPTTIEQFVAQQFAPAFNAK